MGLSQVGSTSAARESSPRVRGRYFSVVSAVTLALTLWGFSDNWLWRVHQPSNSDPKFVIHGVFCLAWMVVFFVQANLVRTGSVRLHRRLGMSGFDSAVGETVSTVDLYWWIFAVSTWNGLFLSLVVYDWRESGRIHPVTMFCCGFFGATWATVLLF